MARSKSGFILSLFAAILAIVASALVAGTRSVAPRAARDDNQPSTSNAQTFLTGVDGPIYPEAWRVSSLQEALAQVSFETHVPPEDSRLPQTKLTDIFVSPTGSVLVLAYAPIEPTDAVRQSYIEVYQSQWLEKEDPLTSFEIELEASPAEGQTISRLEDGTPALTVQPRSASDAEQANPAFVEFVVRDTHVQIWGGNDLEALLLVANQLVEAAPEG
jgi:hypothetical protein